MTKYENLTRADQDLYNQAITHTHERRIKVHVQTLDGDPVTSLTPYVLSGGQVAHDVTSDVSSSILTMPFVDASGSINFEPDAGGQSLHRKYQVQVVDSRRIPGLGIWVDQDVHTGPIWDFGREGMICSLTAHGVDRLAKGTVRHPMQWDRKTKKTDIIRDALTAAGATHLGGIPDLPATTGHRVTAGFSYVHHKKHHPASNGHKAFDTRTTERKPRTDTYWEIATEPAESMNRHLFGNGSGRFILRRIPTTPSLVVGRHLLAEPQIQRPGTDSPNLWLVIGGKPKGSKVQVQSGPVPLPDWHPLSPDSLVWNNKPYVVEELIKNPHVKRAASARLIARRHRDRAMAFVVDYEFDMLPVPWLVEWDLLKVETGRTTFRMPLRQWTYPLGTGPGPIEPMHVGGIHRTQAHKPHHARHVAGSHGVA